MFKYFTDEVHTDLLYSVPEPERFFWEKKIPVPSSPPPSPTPTVAEGLPELWSEEA
jgi:hypothetical protein